MKSSKTHPKGSGNSKNDALSSNVNRPNSDDSETVEDSSDEVESNERHANGPVAGASLSTDAEYDSDVDEVSSPTTPPTISTDASPAAESSMRKEGDLQVDSKFFNEHSNSKPIPVSLPNNEPEKISRHNQEQYDRRYSEFNQSRFISDTSRSYKNYSDKHQNYIRNDSQATAKDYHRTGSSYRQSSYNQSYSSGYHKETYSWVPKRHSDHQQPELHSREPSVEKIRMKDAPPPEKTESVKFSWVPLDTTALLPKLSSSNVVAAPVVSAPPPAAAPAVIPQIAPQPTQPSKGTKTVTDGVEVPAWMAALWDDEPTSSQGQSEFSVMWHSGLGKPATVNKPNNSTSVAAASASVTFSAASHWSNANTSMSRNAPEFVPQNLSIAPGLVVGRRFS